MIAAGLGVYRNSVAAPFIFDDHESITFNPHLQHLWPVWQAMAAPSPNSIVSGRPVVSLSLALNYALGGLDVFGYHVFNVTLHLLSALLLYGIVRRTLSSARLRDRYGLEAHGLAFAVSLLWTVHPLLTESVTYTIQRTELLMGSFLLLTLYSVIRSADAWPRRGWQVMAVVSCALGMASKEVMVVAPLLVWLYDWIVLAGPGRALWQRRWGLYLGLASTWLLLAILVAPIRHPAASVHFTHLTPWDYAKTQCGVILHYVRLAVWPHPLVLDYYDWPVARTLAQALPSILVVGVLLAGTGWALARRLVLGFVGAWFFLILAPTSSVLPIMTEMAAERRMYLPLVAVVVLLVVGGWRLLERLRSRDRVRRSVAVGLAAAIATTLGALTIRRHEDYRSEIAIWQDTVAKRPGNARARLHLGKVLQAEGQLEAAIAQYRAVLRFRPLAAEASYDLGSAMTRQGNVVDAAAHYRNAIRLKPDMASAHYNLSLVLEDQGKPEEAVAEYETVLRLTPDSIEAHNNLGLVLVKLGRLDEAIVQYREALRLAPGSLIVHRNLERALTERRQAPRRSGDQ